PGPDGHRRSAAENPPHVGPALRCAQIGNQKKRTRKNAGERQIASRTRDESISSVASPIGNRCNNLAFVRGAGCEQIAWDWLTKRTWLEDRPAVVGFASVI